MTSLHQRRTHPIYVDGCFGCRAHTLLYSPAIELRVQTSGDYAAQRRVGEIGRAHV